MVKKQECVTFHPGLDFCKRVPDWPDAQSIREEKLTFLLGECINHIEENGFVSTVGHATASALCRLVAGQWPQVHYYPGHPGTFWAKVWQLRKIRLFD